MALITYREAMSRALREALNEDERVFMVGEDIGPYGGTYAVTRGFFEEFGPERIMDSPLAESGIVGLGIGSAVAGLRPIVEIMTINFTLLALDQIVNHAAKLRYMSGNQLTVPLIIRSTTGGGTQVGATHSQSLEGWFATVPGLKVVVPSTGSDALGLFRACRDEMDPVIFLEHSRLYSHKSEVSDDNFKIPLGQADIKRQGEDLTIIAYSAMVHVALEVADRLSREGAKVEVIDLRTLRPWDETTVIESVEKTHKAIVVEEACKTGAFGAEIVSTIQSKAFDSLDGPVQRMAGEDVPMPYSRHIEKLAIPDAERLLALVKSTLAS